MEDTLKLLLGEALVSLGFLIFLFGLCVQGFGPKIEDEDEEGTDA